MPPEAERWAWLAALRDPQCVVDWTLADWQHVMRLGRRLRLLGRLAGSVLGRVDEGAVPVQVLSQLRAEQRLARSRTRALCWAAERAGTAMQGADYPRVLLKGAAYIAQGLDIAEGRMPSDIDLLVPRAHLADAQRRLSATGWRETPLDAHDQRYYREWSHEVPPMRHPQHSLELDLHHNILPPVARLRVDDRLLLARVQGSPWAGWHVLHPADQILHSAAHLFQDPELIDRVRDLVDLDALLRQQGDDASTWGALVDRALELGLAAPLALACHFTSLWFQTPVPQAVRDRLRPHEPGRVQRLWLLPALQRVLTPTPPDDVGPASQRLAARLLLARYHLTRMPMHLLLPHAWHKLRLRSKPADAAPDGQPAPRTVDEAGGKQAAP